MRSSIWKFSRNFSLLLYGILIVVFMYLNYRHDPPNPALTGTATYGRNVEGEFEQNLNGTGAELVILYLILRPWSYRHSWGRSLAALILFFPWTGLHLINMHAGGTTTIHGLGLLLLETILLGMTLVSGFQAIRNR
ncbi:MAG: hypothetical protein U0401_05710 [Anaerolineae bacterium]